MSLVPFLPLVTKVIDKIFPNKAEADKAKYELEKLHQKGELAFLDADIKLAIGQMGVNLEEAKHPNWFVAGWRPAAGWTCVGGLSYQFLAQPLLAWFSSVMVWPIPPEVDTSVLISMLGGMLGLGVYRSYEKLKGVVRS